MKKKLSVLALILFVSGASFASFPIKSANKNENATVAASKKTQKQSTVSEKEDSKVNQKMERRAQAQVKFTKRIEALSDKNAANGDNKTVALILAIVSVLVFPFGLHNWYLGRKKQALWQTLLVFPGFILLGIPALISWIWQIVDLVRLIVNGELPS